LTQFFDAASVRGAAPGKAALFDPGELAGEWSTQAYSLASYVNSSGGYVGDASIAIVQSYKLHGDGTFAYRFDGVRAAGPAVHEASTGRWRIQDGTLVLDKTGGKVERRRVFAVGLSPKGTPGLFLPSTFTGTETIELGMPRRPLSGDWYAKVK
jgi:hypothetical protein